jgi:hypothetical protein
MGRLSTVLAVEHPVGVVERNGTSLSVTEVALFCARVDRPLERAIAADALGVEFISLYRLRPSGGVPLSEINRLDDSDSEGTVDRYDAGRSAGVYD